jgi:chaperonin GroEL (HSP60 family)
MDIAEIKNIVRDNDIAIIKHNEDSDGELGVAFRNKSNVVSGEKLRQIQSTTLSETKDFLSKTFGPMGSNSIIIKGVNQSEVTSSYSKDGLKVLSNVINSGPIEASIVEELLSVTRAVEKEVGDGTTSTVILSSLIFDRLRTLENKYRIPPFKLCREFDKVVEEINSYILKDGRECTLDDIYNISMISTNGNEFVSESIRSIYEKYGMDVELSVGISNTKDSLVKVYDGLTITEGMSDPVFINNKTNNTSEIHNAHIYHFADPIDTMEQIALFEAILAHNIYEPYENDEEPIPTVITCPKLSKDLSSTMKQLANQLYQFDNQGAESAKPPILIIADVVASDEIIMDDIANLCGCKTIRKYIDPKVYEKDKEAGNAPSIDNVFEFCGHAELVVSDSKKTKFINPLHMIENGEEDPIYTAMVNFLETEIEQEKASENPNSIGLLKKRLSALKANMVDFLVGGITISDRDMLKDLVEDAVKNCKSASLYGVGYAANYEGLANSLKVLNDKRYNGSDLEFDIALLIFESYIDVSKILYNTVELDTSEVENLVWNSLQFNHPYNISEGYIDLENGNKVLCSIKLDTNILKDVSKIITMMLTANQALLMSANVNVY